MEQKQTKNRRLISVLILIFVVIGAILVLAEIYNNVSEKLDEKISIREKQNRSFGSAPASGRAGRMTAYLRRVVIQPSLAGLEIGIIFIPSDESLGYFHSSQTGQDSKN